MKTTDHVLLIAVLLVLFSGLAPRSVVAQSSGDAQPLAIATEQPLNAADIRAILLSPQDRTSGAPDLLLIVNEAPARDTLQPGASPIDTLRKSPLEKVFWGKYGFYRITGIFREDPNEPTNDLRNMARWRRTMLSLHQAFGLATIASMTATVVGGQLAIDGRGSKLHTTSLPFTIGLYATTATLALTSPPKLVPSHGIDTITFHKWFAAAHLTGMIVTPMLAPDFEDGSRNDARTHQIFGYATYAAFTAGMIIVTFFR